jgi:hypothetical protein
VYIQLIINKIDRNADNDIIVGINIEKHQIKTRTKFHRWILNKLTNIASKINNYDNFIANAVKKINNYFLSKYHNSEKQVASIFKSTYLILENSDTTKIEDLFNKDIVYISDVREIANRLEYDYGYIFADNFNKQYAYYEKLEAYIIAGDLEKLQQELNNNGLYNFNKADKEKYIHDLLNQAIQHNKFNCFQILLEKYTEIYDLNNIATDIMNSAILYDNVQIIQHLVSQGVNLNTKNKLGNTAVIEAVIQGRTNILEYLLKLKDKCDFDIQNNDGNTALMLYVICYIE